MPDKKSGNGGVDTASALEIVRRDGQTGFWKGEVSRTVTMWQQSIDIQPGYSKLKVTLIWSDLPGRNPKNKLLLVVETSTGSTHGSRKNNVLLVLLTAVPPRTAIILVGVLGEKFMLNLFLLKPARNLHAAPPKCRLYRSRVLRCRRYHCQSELLGAAKSHTKQCSSMDFCVLFCLGLLFRDFPSNSCRGQTRLRIIPSAASNCHAEKEEQGRKGKLWRR